MKDTIRQILDQAVNAPSGHNAQPWRFVVKGESLFILNIPEKDKTLFNYQQRGSLIAHGALIENIFIIASEKGYQVEMILFPKKEKPDLIAELNFKKNDIGYLYHDLFPFIPHRATNRKPYERVSLRSSDEEKLAEFSKAVRKEQFEIVLINNKENINQIAEVFSMVDGLLFENFYIHKGLFDNVNWTLKEERERREGLYVETKELSSLKKIVFRYFLSKWSIVSELKKINLSVKAAKMREKLYQQCSAVGIILAPNDKPQDFVEAGRIIQRFWLLATSLGLSFQPVSAGLLYLGQQMEIQKKIPDEFGAEQVEFIKNTYQNIIKLFNVLRGVPVFSFRIGYSGPPTAVSLKNNPEIIYYDS